MDQSKLEERILRAWNILDDLDDLASNWNELTDDYRYNTLQGIRSLYELKFQALMNAYETLARNGGFPKPGASKSIERPSADFGYSVRY